MPAILDRSPLMVAFSSGGASPVLTRMMRGKLETMIPQNYSRLAAFAERFREQVKQRVTNPAKRRIFWENVLEGVVAEKVLTGDESSAETMLQQMLAERGQYPARRSVSGRRRSGRSGSADFPRLAPDAEGRCGGLRQSGVQADTSR